LDIILIELLVIAVLILVNGFFACAEFAVISIRKSRVAQLAAGGDSRARIIEELQKDPHRLLAVVQIGMTVVGSTASAIGGVVAVEHLKPYLQSSSIEILRNGAEPIAVSIVVVILSYFLLILGELAPKTIGLQFADPVALHVARPLDIIARIGVLFVRILSLSSRGVLRLFGISGNSEGFISREELQHIVAEGRETGAFTEAENEYIKNLFDFTNTTVREVMVPRTRMAAIDLEATHAAIVSFILESKYSRYPVYTGSIEHVSGFILAKDFLGRIVVDPEFDISTIIRPPFYVPEGKKVNDLLKEMQRKRVHMAIVVDEYGGLSGMVTTEDLLEELVGEIEDEHDDGDARIQSLSDGSFLVDAFLSMNDLEDLLEISIDENLQFDSLAGLILHSLGRFPERGEQLEWKGFLLVCDEVGKNAVTRVRISRIEANDRVQSK
jgi:putative hemolysin